MAAVTRSRVSVVAASTFFLWMFFAAAALERAADGAAVSASTPAVHITAYEFAAAWRHGMAANSPIYMPGFFAAAAAMWFWCAGKAPRRVMLEGTVLIAVACACAAALALLGEPRVLADFSAHTGLVLPRSGAPQHWTTTAQGVYTLVTFSSAVIASRFAIKRRSLRPFAIPLLLTLVLPFVRPWTVDDFTAYWIRQTAGRDATAIASLLLVPTVAAFFAWTELRRRGV